MTNDPWESESAWDSPPTRPVDRSVPLPSEGDAAARPKLVVSAPQPKPGPKPIPTVAGPKPPEAEPKGRRSKRRAALDHDPDEDDIDIEDFPPPPRRGWGLLVFLLFSALAIAGALYGVRWLQRQIDPPGAVGEAMQITIPTNTPTSRIGEILHAEGIIGDPRVFRYYAQWKGRGGFDAGRYTFRKNDTFDAALETLTRGPQVPNERKVTFPEGFRLAQFAERVGARLPGRTAARFMQVATNGTIRSSLLPTASENLEGFLFPSTYQFALDDDEEAVIARLVDAFDVAADAEGLTNASAKVGRSPYEALIVASLIEREAKIEEDRGKVARVIYNRLTADQALQIDATLIYGMGGKVDRVLFEDLEKDGPYNTYTRKGLPPTPIASPGRDSIRAALNPTPGDWLYYVVIDGQGHHAFATTFKEHKKNIKIAEQNGVR